MAEHLLKIVVDGKALVLYPNEKVKFVMKSPLMALQPEIGSRVYSFRIPAEPNSSILGIFNRLDNRSGITTKDCQLYLGTDLFTKGKLDITKYDNREFEIKVRFDRTFYQEFAQKSFKDFEYKRPNPYRYNQDKSLHPYRNYVFDFGSMSVNDQFTITLTYNHPENRKTSVVISNTFVYDGSLGFFDTVVNYFVDYLTSTFNTTGFFAENIGLDTLRLYEYFNYVQLPILEFISSNNSFCQIVPQADVVPNATVVRNNLYMDSISSNIHDFVFFPVFAPSLFDPTVSSSIYNEFINLFNPRLEPTYPGESASGMLVPFPYVWEVIYQLHKEFGITIEEDNFFDDENKTLVFWTDQIINNTLRVPERGWEGQKLLSFLFKNIVPEITVSQQIIDLRSLFNVVVDYNSKKSSIRILTANSILNSKSYTDLSSKVLFGFELENKSQSISLSYNWPSTELLAKELLPEVDKDKFLSPVNFKDDLPPPLKSDGFETRYAEKENNIYKYDPTLAEWVLYAQELYDKINDSESINIKSSSSPLFQITQELINKTTFYLTKWLIPYTKQTGNVYKFNQTEFPHRYLYFRGWQYCDVKETTEGPVLEAEYPFGSYHNYNFKNERIGNYSLSWNHEDGLIKTWWSKFIDFLYTSRPVIFMVNLSLKDLLEMDLLEKKLVNNQLYFFDEIEFEVTDKISVSKVKAYSVKNRYE